MNDLWKDLSHGIMLAKVIMFYKPDILSVESVFLNEDLAFEDKVSNWITIFECCREHLNVLGTFDAEIIAQGDDYSHKPNLLAFLAELFLSLLFSHSEQEHISPDNRTLRNSSKIIPSVIKSTVKFNQIIGMY